MLFFLLLVSIFRSSNCLIETAQDVQLYPPWVVTYRYVNENYRVICRCFVPFSEIKWYKLSGEPIPESGAKVYAHVIQSGIVLIFKNITSEAEGEYECIAVDRNTNKTYNNRFKLNVAEPIVFNSPTIYEVVVDETVLLQCKVNEKIIPERYWEFKGNSLLSEQHFQIETEGMLIPNVGLQDAGKYYCVISHSPFQSNSNRLEITLVVYHKPVARQDNITVFGYIDHVTSVPCKVTANPNAWFIWYNKRGQPINPKNDNITIVNGDNESHLQVFLTEYKMEYKFICEACNQLGCVQQTAIVKSTTKLQVPDIGLWDIDSDSAKFYVTIQNESTLYIFQYFFDVDDDSIWKKAFTQSFNTSKPKAKLGNYVAYEVDGLHPDTKYVLRVAAANQYTISEYSVERRFKTRIGMTIHTFCSSCNFLKIDSVLLTFYFVVVFGNKIKI